MDTEELRLDVLLSRKIKDLTRSQASKLIESGKVTVDKAVITKPSARFSQSVNIKVNIKKNSSTGSLKIPIIYEDDDVVVINKPIGVISHSKGSFNEEETIAEWLNKKLSKKAVTNRDGIVHRLDRGTSGVMILAKNEQAKQWLAKQFSTRKVIKKYIAIVRGHLETPEAIIDMPITRNQKRPQSFKVSVGGKPAQTKYQIITDNKDYSMIELTPTTGRTHQLRVHLSAISHPIVGDPFYGGIEANRVFLHALSLEITLPTKERKTFEAPMPKEFNKLMSR